eukprot:3755059-Pleurochrysis_carterae.AAC.1
MALWWQSASFLLPEPLRHPEHVDAERMSATCPYHLAEVAQFNWLSEVDWMSSVPADERLVIARMKARSWLRLLHNDVDSRLRL